MKNVIKQSIEGQRDLHGAVIHEGNLRDKKNTSQHIKGLSTTTDIQQQTNTHVAMISNMEENNYTLDHGIKMVSKRPSILQ